MVCACYCACSMCAFVWACRVIMGALYLFDKKGVRQPSWHHVQICFTYQIKSYTHVSTYLLLNSVGSDHTGPSPLTHKHASPLSNRTYTHIRTPIHSHKHIFFLSLTWTQTYANSHTLTSTHTYTHMHSQTNAHTCFHTRKHTHTHTHTDTARPAARVPPPHSALKLPR
jgi:hypothetical protein